MYVISLHQLLLIVGSPRDSAPVGWHPSGGCHSAPPSTWGPYDSSS